MKKTRRGLIVFLIGLMLTVTSMTVTLATFEQQSSEWIYVEDTPVRTSVEVISQSMQNPTFANNQVTENSFDDRQPSVDIDYNGNPFLMYQIEEDFSTSTIAMRRSPDAGASWPAEQAYSWDLADLGGINPELSFMADGVRAFATHETITQDPIAYLHDYVDIEDSSTWGLYTFDFSSSSTYCAETSLTTNGTSIVALASIVDYSSGEYNLDDTLKINWNVESGDGSWPGVFYINEDNQGRSEPRSNVCADSGEQIFFVYQEDGPSINSRILATYCKVDETTEYTDWDSSNVAVGTDYNCTYPDISVTGDTAYVTYMVDKDGSQDVYVAKSNSGFFWTKTAVATTGSDELYPVISASGDKVVVMYIMDNDLYKVSSDDAGFSWSEPEQVNDVSGSVDDSYRSMDVYGASVGFWTDDRNGNLDIFTDNVGNAPLLRIEEITGGFGIGATVANVGTAAAEDISWDIILDGTVFLGASASGTLSLDAGESATLSSGFILGFGNIDIQVKLGDTSKTASAFCLGPFVLNVS